MYRLIRSNDLYYEVYVKNSIVINSAKSDTQFVIDNISNE